MKKNLAILAIVLVFVFMVFGTAGAWQGRMAGMNDPYGLIQDESDMLIHPAMIMNSSGFRFYTHYRFTYTDVMNWDYEWNFDPGFGEFDYNFNASGDEFKHEALIGSTFNLGPGRMGIFFNYDNFSSEYDGSMDTNSIFPFQFDQDIDMDSDKDDFTLSLLYGFPINCIDLGFEAGFAYHNEENNSSQKSSAGNVQNNIWPLLLYPEPTDPAFAFSNLLPYMIPYDSEYYEGFAKVSIASEIGCAIDFGFTFGGGYILSGDNELDYSTNYLFDINADLDGDVDGWSLGGDFWLRYKVDDQISLPFLFGANYKTITRDGNGNVSQFGNMLDWDYEHEQVNWDLELGGGIDLALDDTSQFASGIYYQYLVNKNNFSLDIEDAPPTNVDTDMDNIPNYKEQRITLKLAYEKKLSSAFSLRAGLDGYYGWCDWRYKNDSLLTPLGIAGRREDITMDGNLWGVSLALGGTIKLDPVAVEPFLGFAYQQIDLDGDGEVNGYGGVPTAAIIEGDSKRDQWMLTAGASILF